MPLQIDPMDVSSVTDVTVAARPIVGPVTCDTFSSLFRGDRREQEKKEFCCEKRKINL